MLHHFFTGTGTGAVAAYVATLVEHDEGVRELFATALAWPEGGWRVHVADGGVRVACGASRAVIVPELSVRGASVAQAGAKVVSVVPDELAARRRGGLVIAWREVLGVARRCDGPLGELAAAGADAIAQLLGGARPTGYALEGARARLRPGMETLRERLAGALTAHARDASAVLRSTAEVEWVRSWGSAFAIMVGVGFAGGALGELSDGRWRLRVQLEVRPAHSRAGRAAATQARWAALGATSQLDVPGVGRLTRGASGAFGCTMWLEGTLVGAAAQVSAAAEALVARVHA